MAFIGLNDNSFYGYSPQQLNLCDQLDKIEHEEIMKRVEKLKNKQNKEKDDG